MYSVAKSVLPGMTLTVRHEDRSLLHRRSLCHHATLPPGNEDTASLFAFLHVIGHFGVTLVHVNLCLHTFTHMTVSLRGVGGRGLFKKFIAAAKCIFCQKIS